MAEGMESVETIFANLQEYREQIAQVEELLKTDPTNEEYLELHTNLVEVRDMTEDLLATAQGTTATEAPASSSAAPVALGPPRMPVGSECQAMWSDEQPWCDAIIQGYTENTVQVVYVGYEDQVYELELNQIKPRAQVVDVYQGVIAPKRIKVSEEILPKELPKKYIVKEDDDEATRERKRKQAKAFKSKVRMQEKDQASNQKQNDWKSFMTGKGKKNKVGFLTGKKKESIFKTSEEGKVGVVGSGKGLTNFTDRSRVDRLAE